jgi:hypothetical protein
MKKFFHFSSGTILVFRLLTFVFLFLLLVKNTSSIGYSKKENTQVRPKIEEKKYTDLEVRELLNPVTKK